MSTTKDDPDQLEDLTEKEVLAMVRLIKSGKLDFEVHSTNPGHYSHEVSISVDHEDLMALLATQKKTAGRKSRRTKSSSKKS